MPNTREKLIELIRKPIDIMPGRIASPYIKFTLPYAEELADHLVANGVTVQQWIPVSERLPEHKGNYLGFTGSTTMVGYYKGNGIWWIWLNDREGENLFTHWMPLPTVPEEE